MIDNPRIAEVLTFLEQNGIGYELHTHPPLPTIELALEYWKDIDSTHCKNLFFRNHKGNRHYLVVFECHKELAIHSLEQMLKQGKLSFASSERMERCLGLLPGSVSPLGQSELLRGYKGTTRQAFMWQHTFLEPDTSSLLIMFSAAQEKKYPQKRKVPNHQTLS